MAFYKEDMIKFMASHPEAFEEAIRLAVENRQSLSWRAAWLLWSCMEENDARVREHVPAIIRSLQGKSDGHQRELLKILYLMEIDEFLEGALFDHCVRLWEKVHKQASVRINALKVILKLVGKHPDLAQEIAFLTEDHYVDTLSPGVQRAVRRMLKKP